MSKIVKKYSSFDIVIEFDTTTTSIQNVINDQIKLLLPQSTLYKITGIFSSLRKVGNSISSNNFESFILPYYRLNFFLASNDNFYYGTKGRAIPANPAMFGVLSPGQALSSPTVGFGMSHYNEHLSNLDLAGNGIIIYFLSLQSNSNPIGQDFILEITIEYEDLDNC